MYKPEADNGSCICPAKRRGDDINKQSEHSFFIILGEMSGNEVANVNLKLDISDIGEGVDSERKDVRLG